MPLNDFTERLFGNLRRADQRRWAQAYLAALLITPGKKSVRRLADAVSASPTAMQSLRQFVSLSPWDWEPVMRELTRWTEGQGPASAWTLGRAVMPKRGQRSVGVHRCFDPSSGRTLNCQRGLGAFLCIGAVQVPVDWRLFLPAPWTEDVQLRKRARIPDTVEYRPLWAHALDLVDTLTARTASTGAPVVADMSDDPDVGLLLRGLSQRGRDFVVAVPQHLKVLPAGERASNVPGPISAKDHASSGSSPETVLISTPDGQQQSRRVHSALVHLPGVRTGPAAEYPYRLFTEVLPDNRTGAMWITSLTHRSLDNVASLAALRTCTGTAVTAMESDFGLLDFEGRSFPGWYHHMTLVSAAYTYQRLSRSSFPQPSPCCSLNISDHTQEQPQNAELRG
ncbi:transposase [Streptomyces sp. XD-27]|uniref:IS701 family transposase n=1 Tax=Streptomyces sp. XD-27 TaxID=3062779 RepID=UPI0026F42343|nr:transposase [Streptomyces sp. XD-27]WKX72586.1 transposase [Streptomyces sp. XD-27]